MRRLLLAALALLVARGRPREVLRRPRLLPLGRPDLLAERIVIGAFVLAGFAGMGFIAVYVVGADTQLLGLSLGLAFVFLAATAIIAGKALVPQEEVVEERGADRHEAVEAEIVQTLEESKDRITRRKLMKRAGIFAGACTLGALVVPIESFGPFFGGNELTRTPWRRGRRLVDESGLPFDADRVDIGSFYTAFPEGAPRERLGSPLVVVRLPLELLDLPPERDGWAPDGIMAFSKICPHAGCAVSIYRWPLFPERSPKAALVCPCHYSTFDVARGGELIFGPAGRPLPQLPLRIGADGTLQARSDFPENVGPSWWGVRSR